MIIIFWIMLVMFLQLLIRITKLNHQQIPMISWKFIQKVHPKFGVAEYVYNLT